MNELLVTLHDMHIDKILVALGVALVLIDYFFPTDIACQFGYVSLAAAVFFLVDYPIGTSIAIAVAVWLILLILHFVFFHRLLANVPNDEIVEEAAS